MLPEFLRKAIVRVIKRRVIRRTQLTGDYESATSFIINAPMKEWRSRLWLVENVSDGPYCCTDEAVYRWLTRHS